MPPIKSSLTFCFDSLKSQHTKARIVSYPRVNPTGGKCNNRLYSPLVFKSGLGNFLTCGTEQKAAFLFSGTADLNKL